ncbi:hypothetical protein GCM10010129_19580 [Streptomyces fumigatiscleroticus]|nr:hypothetical protein GCM10010129_19580 [Streptomyces fumigatiscleroticus]
MAERRDDGRPPRHRHAPLDTPGPPGHRETGPGGGHISPADESAPGSGSGERADRSSDGEARGPGRAEGSASGSGDQSERSSGGDVHGPGQVDAPASEDRAERSSGGDVRGPGRVGDGARAGVVGLEAVLAAAVRVDGVDARAQERAVAAFRAARDAGAHESVRTRRRDDWRPEAERRSRRPLRATLSVALAGLALGGAAYAAIGGPGPADRGADDDHRSPRTSAGTPAAQPVPGSSATAPGTAPTAPGRHPSTAQDAEAHCRAYEHVKDEGKALDAAAWQRLVAAAGGEKNVSAYCSGNPARAAAGNKPGKGNGTAHSGNADAGSGQNAGRSGQGRNR